MKRTMFKCVIVLGIASSLFISCKKNTAPSTEPLPVTPDGAVGSRDELTKDSIFLYSKELYFWYASLPTYDVFKPRSFNSNETELYALTQYSNNPQTTKPYEYLAGYTKPKYSYIDYDVVPSTKRSALKADLSGTASDFGFSVKYNTTTDLRVTYVYEGSSAAKNGLTRGCRILSVNGNSSLTYGNAAIDFLNDAIFGSKSSISITYLDASNITKSATITNATYTLNPILYSDVLTANSKKIGYIVFNSYTSNALTGLNSVFANFTAQGVTELIVDLRYNGGGYVSTATQLINLIAPASQNGKTMFTTYYNDYLQNLTSAQRKASVLVNQPVLNANGKLQNFTGGVNGKYATYADLDYTPASADNIEKFAKSGALNVNRIYFLVTSSTASAAELTINSLKPVVDVKLIGATTYGKPVGFFPIRIDKLDLYIPEFETKNQLGVGGYYTGLTVDKSTAEDLTKAWGDENETLLANALQYAKTGAYITTIPKSSSLKTGASVALSGTLTDAEIKNGEQNINPNQFEGMIIRPRKFVTIKAN